MAYLRIKHFIKTRPVTYTYQIKFNNGLWHVVEEHTREVVGAFKTEQEASQFDGVRGTSMQFVPQHGAKPL